MKVVVAPDSFKECLDAAAVAERKGERYVPSWLRYSADAKRLSIVTLAETMPECEFGFTP